MAHILQDNYETGESNTLSRYGVYWAAQTFTPSSSYTISRVSLYSLRVGNPSTVTASIRATSGGAPTGADLCTATADGNGWSTSLAWHSLDFSSGASLSSGTTYAIVVRAAGGDENNSIGLRANYAGDYGGGANYISSNSGVNWTLYSARDLYFRTYLTADNPITMSVTSGGAGGGVCSLQVGAIIVMSVSAGGTGGGTCLLRRGVWRALVNPDLRMIAIGNNTVWYSS